ncbi:hypothetical protein [Nonomuraea dietziae]|uniref:hypothetical protein n=1 Tax=Nonomuraea dietziae TaxID=65515 RepID=UPI003F4D35FE
MHSQFGSDLLVVLAVRAAKHDLRPHRQDLRRLRSARQQANRKRRGRSGGRPPTFDADHYDHRNQVERGFNRSSTTFNNARGHYS